MNFSQLDLTMELIIIGVFVIILVVLSHQHEIKMAELECAKIMQSEKANSNVDK